MDEKTQRTYISNVVEELGWKIKSLYRNPLTNVWHIDVINFDDQIRFQPPQNATVEEFVAQFKKLLGVGDIVIEDEIENLRNRTPDNILTAMYRLQEAGEPAVTPLIQALLNPNESPYFRSKVAGTLAKIGSVKAVEPLIESLKDSNVEFRWSVVKALADVGDESAISHLEYLATTDDGSFDITNTLKVTIKDAAIEAVEEIKKRVRQKTSKRI